MLLRFVVMVYPLKKILTNFNSLLILILHHELGNRLLLQDSFPIFFLGSLDMNQTTYCYSSAIFRIDHRKFDHAISLIYATWHSSVDVDCRSSLTFLNHSPWPTQNFMPINSFHHSKSFCERILVLMNFLFSIACPCFRGHIARKVSSPVLTTTKISKWDEKIRWNIKPCVAAFPRQ